MGKKAKSQLDKELDQRSNRRKSLIELFIDDMDDFKLTTETRIHKKVKELLKDTFDYASHIRRSDVRKYGQSISFTDLQDQGLIVQVDPLSSDDTVYYSIRGIRGAND